LLVRFTRNCPWNKCTFCGMYKTEQFEVRSPEEIKKDIDAIHGLCNDLTGISQEFGYGGSINREIVVELIRRVSELSYHQGFAMVCNWLQAGGKTAFLQDGNSLTMKTGRLVDLLKYLKSTFPSITRITSYARSKTLMQKKPDELEAIREAGLDRLHVGLESGDDDVLKRINKGVIGDEHIKGGQKAMKAGFQLSEYWMPGLGGKSMWQNHARNTARVLSEIKPDYIRSRPLHLQPGTPLYEEYEMGELQMLSPNEQLQELKLMIDELDVTSRVCFDHAGNYWRNRRGELLFSQDYEGYKFPEEKGRVLELIEEGLTVQNQERLLLHL
jgi:radical SAM superfamily enzyme YgiQ (UPF0313 family)